ncbi:MAG: transposase [Christensenellaceae bacterium]|jgi:hypothetical protein|nr:transposase [Christensenellaceae bacterium]
MSRKKIVQSYIRYNENVTDGTCYAVFLPADRRHGGKDLYLGITVDKKNQIFYNRRIGYYKFTIEDGIQPVDPDIIEYYEILKKRNKIQMSAPLVLDYGDVWLFNELITQTGIKSVFKEVLSNESDTLLALIAFKILDTNANCYAERWYSTSLARFLYPNAKLDSPRISEFLERLGTVESKQAFFNHYVPFFKNLPDVSENVLIDSTGLQTDAHFDSAKISNHNGIVNKESRLIYVVERNTGLPVYFRSVPGNIVDVTTLKITLDHLKAYDLDAKHSILDAGYCSEKNIVELFKKNIPFLIRMPNGLLAKKLITQNGSDIMSTNNLIEYNQRVMFIKKVAITLYDHECYIYISIDLERKQDEEYKAYIKYLENKDKKIFKKENANSNIPMGGFILISSNDMTIDEVLPLYYMRQTIEQTFDYLKNDVCMLPVRNSKAETFNGHLLLSFMATIAIILIKRHAKKRKKLAKFPATQILQSMRCIKGELIKNLIIPTEPDKYANLIIKELNLDGPSPIKI